MMTYPPAPEPEDLSYLSEAQRERIKDLRTRWTRVLQAYELEGKEHDRRIRDLRATSPPDAGAVAEAVQLRNLQLAELQRAIDYLEACITELLGHRPPKEAPA
jgi:hypothetical protein